MKRKTHATQNERNQRENQKDAKRLINKHEKAQNSTHIINITSQSFNYFMDVSVSAYCFFFAPFAHELLVKFGTARMRLYILETVWCCCANCVQTALLMMLKVMVMFFTVVIQISALWKVYFHKSNKKKEKYKNNNTDLWTKLAGEYDEKDKEWEGETEREKKIDREREREKWREWTKMKRNCRMVWCLAVMVIEKYENEHIWKTLSEEKYENPIKSWHAFRSHE